jgi:hypothetical protein
MMKMNEFAAGEQGFVGYEYKNVTVKQSSADLYADAFPSFGWMLEGAGTPLGLPGSVAMKFKRNRKIPNKVELTRLQRQFEAQIAEVECLESSKSLSASTVAYLIGVVGTAFMAASVFAFLADLLILCIILAIPAFAGWVIPYFCFTNIRKRKTAKLAPIIDSKYDEIYEACEKANGLLAV